MAGVQTARKRQGAKKEMFKQRLLSLPVERIYNNEKCIFSSAAVSAFHILPLSEKQCCLKACVLARRNKVHVTFNMNEQSEKSLQQIWKEKKRSLECEELELLLNTGESQTASIKKGAWWWLTSIGYISLPRMIILVFILPPAALSPSALFGLSEEACETLMWFLSSHSPQLLLPRLLNVHLIKLITGQETEGPRVWSPIAASQKQSENVKHICARNIPFQWIIRLQSKPAAQMNVLYARVE